VEKDLLPKTEVGLSAQEEIKEHAVIKDMWARMAIIA
jgi:hypothetical protein